jgi:hypothetical protein
MQGEFSYTTDPKAAIEQWGHFERLYREASLRWEQAYTAGYAAHPDKGHEERAQEGRSAAIDCLRDMWQTNIDATKAAAWAGQVTGNKHLFGKTPAVLIP